MNQQVRKVVVSLGVVLAAFVLIDKCAGRIVDRVYFAQSHKKAYALNGVHEDLLVMGYSRAENHYISSVLQDSTGFDCFNFGTGGQNIYYQYALLKTILQRHVPNVVLLELGSIDYLRTSSVSDKDKLSQLSPLYTHCSAVKELLDGRGRYERWKFLLRLYAFNSTLSDMIYAGCTKGNNPSMRMHGYIPINGEYDRPIADEVMEYKEFDFNKIDYIERFVDLCEANNIRLVVAISPAFQMSEIEFRPQIVQKLKGMKVPVLDYSSLLARTEFRHYFKDALHLNHLGAEYYTPVVATDLKSIINNK